MITASQMRAARALLGIDQRQLAILSGVSLPTIQRMESSDGNVRGVIGSLTKIVEAIETAGTGEKERRDHRAADAELRELLHARERVRGWLGERNEAHWRRFLAAWRQD